MEKLGGGCNLQRPSYGLNGMNGNLLRPVTSLVSLCILIPTLKWCWKANIITSISNIRMLGLKNMDNVPKVKQLRGQGHIQVCVPLTQRSFCFFKGNSLVWKHPIAQNLSVLSSDLLLDIDEGTAKVWSYKFTLGHFVVSSRAFLS